MKKKAVGIGYDEEKDNVPRVIAKGEGRLAEQIIEVAKENGIYIKKDRSLLEILYKLDISQEIPEDLYEIIAEIFMYIYRMDKEV